MTKTQDTQTSDEHLIRLYHDQNDQAAFRTLFERYDPLLRKKATMSSSNHRCLDYQAFYDRFLDRLISAVNGFDVGKNVPFRKYVAMKLYRDDVNLVMDKQYIRGSDGTLRQKATQQVVSFDAVRHDRDDDTDDSDRRLALYASKTDDYPFEIDEVTAVCTDEERLAIKAAICGDSLADIARAAGRTGSQETLTKYGLRLMNRVRGKVRDFYKLL